MAALRMFGQLISKSHSAAPKLLKPESSVIASDRMKGYWNRDWKPNPVAPETPEQRAAAAHKYGLIPADYKPMPDDGERIGDYPDIPLVAAEARDPYYNWDMPELRRDYSEPLHQNMDMHGEDRYNANRTLRYSLKQMLAAFMSVMVGYTLLFIYFDDKKMFRPVMPPHYRRDGVHYTFELKEE